MSARFLNSITFNVRVKLVSYICHVKNTTCNCMLKLTKQGKHKVKRGPCGLMDKASDFESEDCEFESRHGLPLFRLHINVTKTKNRTHGCW